MKESARYAKIVEWSEEDQCFVGSSPGLIYGGCHGPDEKAVFEELGQVVEEAIALYHQDGNLYRHQRQAATTRTKCRTSHNSEWTGRG
jgi:predicted RNase H-like HicB family nuclease